MSKWDINKLPSMDGPKSIHVDTPLSWEESQWLSQFADDLGLSLSATMRVMFRAGLHMRRQTQALADGEHDVVVLEVETLTTEYDIIAAEDKAQKH